MKYLNTILIALLAAAVIVLYVLHFGQGKDEQSNVSTGLVTEFSGDLPIAYVNIDSILPKMKMFTDLQAEMQSEQQKMEASFANRYKTFEQSVSRYQNDVSKGLLTRSEMQEKEQQLNNERINLEGLQNDYMAKLQEKNIVSNRKITDYIMEYLKEYNEDKNFKYIFSYSFGSNLLYANEELEITDEVVNGLNMKYESQNPATKK
jgi:outer membrane protein